MGNHSFASLSREHEVFLAFLQLKHSNPSQFYDLNRWKMLATLLEEFHHEKEERFLFPNLLQTDALNEGGIKCSTFFSPRVLNSNSWPDSYHELVKALELSELKFHSLDSFRQSVFNTKNMLMIPVEDHILGAIAMRRILQKHTDHNLIDKFSVLLKDHIEREEDCLFELCERVLNMEQKNSFVKNTKKFDEQNLTNALLTKLLAP